SAFDIVPTIRAPSDIRFNRRVAPASPPRRNSTMDSPLLLKAPLPVSLRPPTKSEPEQLPDTASLSVKNPACSWRGAAGSKARPLNVPCAAMNGFRTNVATRVILELITTVSFGLRTTVSPARHSKKSHPVAGVAVRVRLLPKSNAAVPSVGETVPEP